MFLKKHIKLLDNREIRHSIAVLYAQSLPVCAGMTAFLNKKFVRLKINSFLCSRFYNKNYL